MLRRTIEVFNKLKMFSSNTTGITPMLGRWCILNKEHNNRKIDMANIDHCGTCYYDYKKENHTIKKESSPPPTS